MKKRLLFFLVFLFAFGLWGCEGMTLPSGFTLPTTEATTTIPTTTGDTSSVEVTTSGIPTTAVPTTVAPTSSGSSTDVPTTLIPTTIPSTSSSESTAPTTTAPVTTAPTTSAPVSTAPTTTIPVTTEPATTSTTTVTTTVSSYSVTFMVLDHIYQNELMEAGSILAEPTIPVIEGKSFLGWFLPDSEVAATFPMMVNQAVTLTARFEDVITEKENHFFIRLKNQTATTVEVEVVLGGNPLKINGYDLRVTYDIEDMQYVSHINNIANIINPDNPGVIRFNFTDPMTSLTTETVLLTITFTTSFSEATNIGVTVIEATVVNESFEISSAVTNVTGLTVTQQ